MHQPGVYFNFSLIKKARHVDLLSFFRQHYSTPHNTQVEARKQCVVSRK